MGWDLSCLCSRSGDKRQSRIGDTPEKQNERRGTQAAAPSRGLAGQVIAAETVPVRYSDSMRPGMGLVPSQEPHIQMKYASTANFLILPATNVSSSASNVSRASSTTALEPDTITKPSFMQSIEPESKKVNFIPDTSHNSSDENTIRFSV